MPVFIELERNKEFTITKSSIQSEEMIVGKEYYGGNLSMTFSAVATFVFGYGKKIIKTGVSCVWKVWKIVESPITQIATKGTQMAIEEVGIKMLHMVLKSLIV